MNKDSLDRLLAGSAHTDVAPPSLDEVVGYRPRVRKVRRSPLVLGAIVIAAGAAFLALPDISQVPADLTVAYATDWLAEPPGYQWISDLPQLAINQGEYHADL